MRIASVVGARPNFMKIAPLREALLRVGGVEHILIHSGQHYDDELSGVFFRELGMPAPDVSLGVGPGSSTWQTAEIMKRIEPVLAEAKPDLVVVVGDVNSTIAAAFAATRLGLKVAHIEAGLRSFDNSMPEEINRKLTDAIADLLFVTEESGVRNLRNEGVPAERIFFVGNLMIDTLLRHRAMASQSRVLEKLHLMNGNGARPYGVLTLHRPSNVDSAESLKPLLKAISEIARSLPILFPIHPRTAKRIEEFGLQDYLREAGDGACESGLISIRPLGYLDFLRLTDQARLVLTDSGGIQEETTVLGVPCLTLRENTERPATIEEGTNQLVGTDPARITAAARNTLAAHGTRSERMPALWDGKAAERVAKILLQQFRPDPLAQVSD
jgi:UDP-N-acetylglucosamine 2-epimerase (non-hydrolysing)